MIKQKGKYVILAFISLLAVLLAFVYSPQKAHTEKTKSEKIVKAAITFDPAVYHDPNPFIQKALADYSLFLKLAIKNGTAPGAAVAIVKDSSIIYLEGFGVKQINTSDSIDVKTVFRLGSVSKSLSAVLAGAMVKDQLINWDDPVIKYLPDFALKSSEYTQKLTLRHVLSHTMGLPYHAFTNMVEERVPIDTLYKELRTLDLIGEPGKIYSYQNVGFSVIGEVMAAATHKTFEETLRDRLFIPLKMFNGSASYTGMMNNINHAQPHLLTNNRWRSIPISQAYYDVGPAGGINASISDMALWLKALLGHNPEVLNKETLNEIFAPQVRAISKNRNFWKWQRPKASYYALGWRVLTFKQDTINYHGGYVNGFRSEVAVDRKNKLAIAVLINAAGNLADQSIPEFLSIYSSYADSINHWENRNKLLVKKDQ